MMPETASLVTGLIMERPLCLNCIAIKASANVAAVQVAFASIRKVLNIGRAEDVRCRACGDVGTVFQINRPN